MLKVSSENKIRNCIHKSINLFLHLTIVQNVSLTLIEGIFF